jgi:hypothetical protein
LDQGGSPSKIAVSGLAVVPYRPGSEIDVLLVMSAPESEWRLPLAAPSKKSPQYTCAALQAQREAGVSGRVYKYPICIPRDEGRMLVFPFVVDPTRDGEPEGKAVRGWFPLRDAIGLVSEDFRPALSAFARRMGQGDSVREPAMSQQSPR